MGLNQLNDPIKRHLQLVAGEITDWGMRRICNMSAGLNGSLVVQQ